MVFGKTNPYMEVKTVKKILAIEDRAETRNFFLESLKSKGFDTIGAENDQIAIELIQEELPDLIVSETIAPKIDGYRVLSILRQNPSTAIIPFIFVSSKRTWTDVRKGMDLGADDYLTKPCTIEELLRAIAIRLEKQATLRQWYTAQSQPVSKLPSVPPQSIFPSHPQLSEVFRFIEDNYYRPITLSDVAVAVGYSSAYLTNLVRRQTGQTVQNWIIERRMAAARLLLLETDRKVEEIATKVGYHCAVHFFRQFRQHHGTTPQAWRNTGRS
jgi:YesN/AraC family two-component response regulator